METVGGYTSYTNTRRMNVGMIHVYQHTHGSCVDDVVPFFVVGGLIVVVIMEVVQLSTLSSKFSSQKTPKQFPFSGPSVPHPVRGRLATGTWAVIRGRRRCPGIRSATTTYAVTK